MQSKQIILKLCFILACWGGTSTASIINPIKSINVPSTNLETHGIWSEKEAGLGHKIWKKSSRATVEGLLCAPWTSFSSPALYKLALRVLLTSTEVPTPEGSSVNLLEMRAQRLYEMGEITYAFDLIKGFSANITPPLFNKIKFSALLTQQKYDEALKIALTQAPTSHDVFWKEAIIFCQLCTGQQESARLALSVYRDDPKIADPEFVLLVEHILGKQQKDVPVSSTHSFMKVLLRLKAGLFPDSLIAMVSPRYLSLLHTYPDFANLSSISRIRIHERMALFVPSNYGTPLLEITYKDASQQGPCPFDAAADPLGNDPILLEDSPLVRAHLFSLFSSAQETAKKTAYAALLLRNALNHKLLVPTSYLLEPFLKDLNVHDPSVQPYILLAGAITNQRPSITASTGKIEDPVLLTLLLLYYPEDGWDEYLWQHKAILETSPHKNMLVGVIYPWQKALGQKLALAIWKHQEDFDPEHYKSPFLLNFLLTDAHLRKQIGETIVLTLLLSTYEEDVRKTIGSFPLMLRGLHRIGLWQPALEMAMEKLSPMVVMTPLSLSNSPIPVPAVEIPVPKPHAPQHVSKPAK